MKRKIAFIVLMGLLISNSMFATIYLVENGSGTSTWRAAGAGEVSVVLSGSLNAWYDATAIVSGDQVWIKNGTYVLDGSITPKGGESIYGGFAGTETAITARAKGANLWNFTNETVLDGNNLYIVLNGANSTTNLTTIAGLTITKGLNTGSTNTGAGAKLNANTTMQNCIVSYCVSNFVTSGNLTASAGGLYVSTGAGLTGSYVHHNTTSNSAAGLYAICGSTVSGCLIDNNTAAVTAGGIYIFQGGTDGVTISNCTISNNVTSSNNGGGISSWQSAQLNTPINITNCIVSNNSIGGSGNGGGIYIAEAATGIVNTYNVTGCTITNNTSVSNGAGLFLKLGTLNVNNCTIAGNTTTNSSGGGLGVIGGTLTLNNTIFKNNSSGTTTGGAINANPVGFTANNCLFFGNTGNSVIQFQSTSAFYTMNNCTVANNFKSDGTTAAGNNVNSTGACQITNSLFLGVGTNPFFVTAGKAQPNVNYCGFESTTSAKVALYGGLVGNIFSITSASFKDAANGDFHLVSSTLAKDAGFTILTVTTDIEGVTRPKGTYYDMGAYEYANTWTGTGNWSSTSNWTSGAAPGTTEDVIIGSGTVTIDASVEVKSLTINAGAKATVNAGVTFTATDFTINSDATNGTGTYVDKGTTTLTNAAKVNQYLTPYRSWYLSSPVFSATPANMSSIRAYDEATYSWLTSTTTMAAKTGYIVTPTNSTISNILFTGSLNHGALSIPIASRTETTNKPGFNLIGNPYPCYLDWNLVTAVPANLAAMRSSTMWYRTKSTGGTYSFWTVNGDGIGVPSTANKYIPPMQAFWVRAIAGGGILELTTNMLSHGPTTDKLLKAPSATKTAMTLVRLEVSNGTNTDEAVIYFSDNSSNGLDVYDAPKMSNDNLAIPEIYTTVGNEQMVINGMNSIQLDTPIGIGFVPGNATSFSIKANELSNLPAEVKMILIDNVTKAETDMTDGTKTYNFEPETTTTDRFSIIFRSAGSTTNIQSAENQFVSIYESAKGQIAVKTNSNEGQVFVYNAVGQKLYTSKLLSNNTLINQSFTSGVYFVKVNCEGKTTTQKLIIN